MYGLLFCVFLHQQPSCSQGPPRKRWSPTEGCWLAKQTAINGQVPRYHPVGNITPTPHAAQTGTTERIISCVWKTRQSPRWSLMYIWWPKTQDEYYNCRTDHQFKNNNNIINREGEHWCIFDDRKHGMSIITAGGNISLKTTSSMAKVIADVHLTTKNTRREYSNRRMDHRVCCCCFCCSSSSSFSSLSTQISKVTTEAYLTTKYTSSTNDILFLFFTNREGDCWCVFGS